MLRIIVFCLLLMSTACAPTTPPLLLAQNCQAEFTRQELLAKHWLLSPKVLRVRQSALLEIGRKKIPMEGFLRLDLELNEARLLAMNDMGVVLFDLQVTSEDEQLHNVLPQLSKVKGLSEGVAQSLRQIFLQPRPSTDDRLDQGQHTQRLLRPSADGSVGFLFDCGGNLRETRLKKNSEDWRVIYQRYQSFGSLRVPEEIVLNDYRHKVKLSLWLREVKEEL